MKTNFAVSSLEILFSGVPQGFLLGPLLFNISICDMFFETPANTSFTVSADDNSPYTYYSKRENVLDNLQGVLVQMLHQFSTNHSLENARKCHLFTISM